MKGSIVSISMLFALQVDFNTMGKILMVKVRAQEVFL
jgi:hypothetical protein